MRYVFLLFLGFAALALGQTDGEKKATSPQQDARKKMEAAIARQKQAVRRQLHLAPDAKESFFTLPWGRAMEPAAAAAPECSPLAAEEIEQLVGEAAKREDLQPELLRSVMAQESGFRPCAVSPKGAQGLMQLMPETAAQWGVKDPFDPQESVASGAKLLKSLLQRYGGNVEAALSAYNAGPGRVDAAGGGVPAIAETVQYVQRILAALGH